jgi:glycosyltransferase involved in cell wall biosynthesis
MTVSIVICTRNRPDDLRASLASIATQRRRPDEVVVVDASSDERARKAVEEWAEGQGGMRVAVLRTPPGLTRQRNRGIDASRGDVVTFLDDDVLLAPGYLAAIIQLFQIDPQLGGAEGTVETPRLHGRRRLVNAARALFGMNSLGARRGVKRSGFVTYDPWPRAARLVSCLVGCNMSFRREVFRRFRFDEWYDGYGLGEDMDFSYRVSRAWRLVQTPHARLVHRVSPVARDAVPRLHEMTAVNHYYFVRKNLPPTALTWLCFAWSELGELLSVLKTGNRDALAGLLRGYRRILREGGVS